MVYGVGVVRDKGMLEPSAPVRRVVDEEAGINDDEDLCIEPKEDVRLLEREPWSACSIL
jgi:hypothetical protein